MSVFKDKVLMITGGTGSFGNAVLNRFLQTDIKEIRNYCLSQIDGLWDEVKRFENPHTYYVDLSEKLWNIKNRLLKEYTK